MKPINTGHSLFNQKNKTYENKMQFCSNSYLKIQVEDSGDYTTTGNNIKEKLSSTANL